MLQIRREYMEAMGRGQAILHNSKTGTNYAAPIRGRMARRSRNQYDRKAHVIRHCGLVFLRHH